MILPMSTGVGFVAVWDRGVPNRERVAVRFDDRVELGFYALVCGPRTQSGGVTASGNHFFKFPDGIIEAGTWVILYTGAGEPRVTRLQNIGTPAHVYHWHQPRTVFGVPTWDVAILFVAGVTIGA